MAHKIWPISRQFCAAAGYSNLPGHHSEQPYSDCLTAISLLTLNLPRPYADKFSQGRGTAQYRDWWKTWIKSGKTIAPDLRALMAAKKKTDPAPAAAPPVPKSEPGQLGSPLPFISTSGTDAKKPATKADVDTVISALNDSVGRIFGLEQSVGEPGAGGVGSPDPYSSAMPGAPPAVDAGTIALFLGAGLLGWYIYCHS